MDYIYVIILDREVDYCRLFRQDSEHIPDGEVLATVKGLRRGYDAMIRHNAERRPIEAYHVCRKARPKGDFSYRVMKTAAPDWQPVETHVSHAGAKAALTRLLLERDNRKERAEKEARQIMARTGISGSRIPVFTQADLRYVEWLKATGRFLEDAA